MVAIEQCATCGRPHVDPRDTRRCSVCEQVFCWIGEPRPRDMFGVETRPCGGRRTHGGGEVARPRIEYRCRRHMTRSWILFGADWPVVRPLALYVFFCVAFSVVFWILIFVLVSAWLRHAGIG